MAREKPARIEGRHLLLVEGQDDRRFWDSFLRHHGRVSIQVVEYGSTSELRREFPAIVRIPGFRRLDWLGIAQDADADPQAALDRIRTALQKEELPIPRRAWELTPGTPSVATFILPGPDQIGDLETLIWQTVEDVKRAHCVTSFLSCLTSAGVEMPQPTSKARTFSYLAACNPPGNRLGEAMQAGFFDFDHPQLAKLLRLLPAGTLDDRG